MDSNNEQKTGVKSLSSEIIFSLFKTMTSEQRRDALLALTENLTKEDAIFLQEEFREKIDKGVIRDDMMIHYCLICTETGVFLTDPAMIRSMHLTCGDYLGGSDNGQLVFVNFKPIDNPNVEVAICRTDIALHGANIIESPDFYPVYSELNKKLVIDKLECVCFKLDPTGIHDPVTGLAKKLTHTPFHLNIIRYLIDLCIESHFLIGAPNLSQVDPRFKKLKEMQLDGYILYRFDIEIDGQKRNVAVVKNRE